MNKLKSSAYILFLYPLIVFGGTPDYSINQKQLVDNSIAHVKERNKMVAMFQKFAAKTKIE